MLLIQITDLHMRRDDAPLSGQIVTRTYISAAVDAINRWAPDMVFITGDLADTGSADEYDLLRDELKRLRAPHYVIPGNHDRHTALRDAFMDHAYLPKQGPMNWVIDNYPVRVIGLDTVVPGKHHGWLPPQTLDWLDATLAANSQPTIIGMHHPPFPTGIPGMDDIMCLNGAQMEPVVARHPHVQRVIAGHHHRPVQIGWGGTVGQIVPSVAHQVALNFQPDQPPEWILEPPAMQLHRWSPVSGLISHQCYIQTYGGRQAFLLEPE